MRKWMLLTVLAALSLTITAQDDDLYFVPTKENVAKQKESYGMPKNTYYSGSQRSVDDYNKSIRSAITPIDSTGSDIIDFSAVKGTYPAGTLAMSDMEGQLSNTADDGDFEYTKRLNRFDDYQLSEAYWDGYRDGRWSSPWYYSAWYDPWYDPWYTGYYGYYGPYYRPWGGYFYYHRPLGYYGWHVPRIYHTGRPGVPRPSRPVNHRPGISDNRPSHNNSRSVSIGGSSFGGHRSTSTGGGSFGGSRSSGSVGGGGNSSGGSRSFGGRR